MGRKHQRVASDPTSAFAAGVFAVPQAKPAAEREAWFVGCVHRLADPTQGCKRGDFDPNGIGSAFHGSCPQGIAVGKAMAAARKAGQGEAAYDRAFDAMNAIRAAHGVKLAVRKS